MSDKQPPVNPFDPEAWREGRDRYLETWAKTMVETVNSEQYAKTTGAVLESVLAASSPFRDVLEKSMLTVLQQLSMPSRPDFTALAERITHIEMRLDDMDAKLDRLIALASAEPRPAPATNQTRTKSKT